MVHPSSTAVPLLAMEAEVELTSKAGKRTVAMRDFYIAPEEDLQHETAVKPGELITAIRVPAPASGTRSAYQKYGEKESFDWPLADAGVVLTMDGEHLPEGSDCAGRGGSDADSCDSKRKRHCAARGSTSRRRAKRESLLWQMRRRLARTDIRCSSSRQRCIARFCWLRGRWDRDPSAIG